MCGLVFAISARPVRSFVLVAHARQHYRGPDGEGVLFEETGGVHMGMAHERLAIVGLSESGAQPMLSASGRFRILFNGEVYNFRELARQFGLHDLKSGTDTEVIVELVERLGIDEAVAHFNGMWAMVIHDIAANRFYVQKGIAKAFSEGRSHFTCIATAAASSWPPRCTAFWGCPVSI